MTNQPITTAAYGKRTTRRKPPAARPTPRAGTSIGRLLGEEGVAEVYRALGLRPPEQWRKRRGPKRG